MTSDDVARMGRRSTSFRRFGAPELSSKVVCGYDLGPWDGIFGPKTRAAIPAFETHEGLPVTGTISDHLEAVLRSVGRPKQ